MILHPARFLALSLCLSACSYVDLKPGAENVIMFQGDASCVNVGTTVVTVLRENASFDRETQTIEDELQTLARNEAQKMGGNTIWPLDAVEDGSQHFKLMKCQY